MENVVDKQMLRQDLKDALTMHIHLLQEVEDISPENMEAVTFMMRSFGFMLDRAPSVLYHEEDEEDLYYMMFQYYSLLNELKYNISMSFPYNTLNGKTLLKLIEKFPTTFETEMKDWWQNKTGIKIGESKQTIIVSDFEF